jgi:hypothetical protein
MKHAAKKIGRGHYEYRDHQIEEVGRFGVGRGGAVWEITHNDEYSARGTVNTLKGAKAMVDYWIGGK